MKNPWSSDRKRRQDLDGLPPREHVLYLAEILRRAIDETHSHDPMTPHLSSALNLVLESLHSNGTRTSEELSTTIYSQMRPLIQLTPSPQTTQKEADTLRAIRDGLFQLLSAAFYYQAYARDTSHLRDSHLLLLARSTPTAFSKGADALVLAGKGNRDKVHHELHTLYRHVKGPTDHHFDPSWRTPDTVNLAREIVQTRNTDLLPILADALEEAGLHDPLPLNQLRHESQLSTPAHWVIRQLLGDKHDTPMG